MTDDKPQTSKDRQDAQTSQLTSQPSSHRADGMTPLQQGLSPYKQSLAGVFCTMASAWVVGCALAIELPSAGGWLIAASVSLLLLITLWLTGRLRHTMTRMVFGVLAVAAASGAWTSTTSSVQRADDIGRYAGPQRTLVRVTGQVDAPPRVTSPPRGAMAKFGYNNIATLYELRVSSIASVQGQVPVTGRLLVREPLRNEKIAQGMRISVMGWLKEPAGPMNPGEMDFRQWMIDRNLAGFLSVPEPDSWTMLNDDASADGSSLVMLRATAGRWSMASLSHGLDHSPQEEALLQTLLLGRRGQGLEAAENAFRRVGLAHILSISGAHLGILVSIMVLGLVAGGAGPWLSAWVVTLTLGFYLLAVPPQVPVVRAAIMALVLVWGYAAGRRVPLLDPLALACILVLMWRPHELYAPGFQLSFGVVAGLVCFTSPVAKVLSPRPAIVGMPLTTFQRIAGWFMAYVAANLVAFMISLPLVMYHFHNISPLTVLLSVLTLPLVTLVLGLGYAKIAIGLVLSGLGSDIAPLLAWLTHLLLAVVQWASSFRVSFIELARGPSVGWTVAALGMVVVLLSGGFRRRYLTLAGCVVLLGVWLAALQVGYRTQADTWPAKPGQDVALRVNLFSVGDGNCYLLRFMPGPDEPGARPFTLMYDCGSRWVDGGLASIIPAIDELGVRKIDMLVISHADMDHFNAVMDLSWRVQIGKVLLSEQMARSIDDDTARSAPAHLLTFLRDQKIPMATINRGWQQNEAGRKLEALWPPADFVVDDELNDNDLSVVLSVQTAGRRLLLSGDIQQIAMNELHKLEDNLKADVTDLPHHGSFIRGNSLIWLDAISPTMVIQSCGMNRVEKDPWQAVLPEHIPRLRTATAGMIELDVKHDGSLVWRTFKSDPKLASERDVN